MRHGVENFVVGEWVGLDSLWESIDVLSIARDSSRVSTREHFQSTVDECCQIVETEGVLSPFKCAACSVKSYGSWLRDHVQISRDTLDDIGSLNKRIRVNMKTIWGAN
jgi:hypothetical protein